LKFFQDKGYDKNIVVLTQPEGYLKKPMPLLSVMKRKYRKFPELVKAMAQRHEMYNAQLEYVKAEERAGRCIVIRPHQSIEVGHFGISAEAMQHIYDQGREAATKVLDKLKAYCQN
jgi:predicted patatin/cPLA2 family phospholipase